MATERKSVCLQLVVGKHDAIIALLMPEGNPVNKNQIIIDALMLYIERGSSFGPTKPPSPPPDPVHPNPSGLAVELRTGLREGFREGVLEFKYFLREMWATQGERGDFSRNKVMPAPDDGPILPKVNEEPLPSLIMGVAAPLSIEDTRDELALGMGDLFAEAV